MQRVSLTCSWGFFLGSLLRTLGFRGLSIEHSSLSLVSFTDPRPFCVGYMGLDPYWVQGSMVFDLANFRSVDVRFSLHLWDKILDVEAVKGYRFFALVILHFGNNMSSDRELRVLICILTVQTSVKVPEVALLT